MRLAELPLQELQKIFAGAVAVKNNNAHAEFVIENGLNAERRLQVYRNNIIHNFTSALRAVYPLVERLVGEEFFTAMAQEYIHQFPSEQGDLHHYGFYFAEFLSTFIPAQSIAYLPEMAQFEWGYHEAFHAAFHQPFDLQKLQTVAADDYPQLKFNLHPAVRLFAFQFPISVIWEVCQREDSDEPITLPDRSENLLLMRPGLEVMWKTLSSGEYALLSTLAQHKNFSEACEYALAVEPSFIVADCLQYHLAKSTIVDFTL